MEEDDVDIDLDDDLIRFNTMKLVTILMSMEKCQSAKCIGASSTDAFILDLTFN